MKKVYEKPVIILESFALSTSIAGTCSIDTNVQSQNVCGFDFSGLSVFLDGMGGCKDIKVTNMGGDGEFNGFCYHVPVDGKNLFNS